MVKSMSFDLRLARNVVKIEKSKGMNCVPIIFGSKMYNNSNIYLKENLQEIDGPLVGFLLPDL